MNKHWFEKNSKTVKGQPYLDVLYFQKRGGANSTERMCLKPGINKTLAFRIMEITLHTAQNF
jgi:hypothetical protein